MFIFAPWLFCNHATKVTIYTQIIDKMERQILLPKAKSRVIKRMFGISDVIIGRALKYERNSARDQRIREAALNEGGLIFTGTPAPANFASDVVTHHDEVNKTINQSLGDRLQLIISKVDSSAKLLLDGEQIATFQQVTLSGWGTILYSMQQIYNQLLAR